MGVGNLMHAFFNDERVQIAFLILILDFVLGTIAALVDKTQGFRLSYLGDTLRSDVLGKMLPFFVLYGGYKYASSADLVIPGLDMEVLMNAAWVIVLAAFGGSILNSLKDLGLGAGLPPQVNGDDPVTPTVPAPPNP
jgi:glycerol-3-phosphate acyltransferase PlsY